MKFLSRFLVVIFAISLPLFVGCSNDDLDDIIESPPQENNEDKQQKEPGDTEITIMDYLPGNFCEWTNVGYYSEQELPNNNLFIIRSVNELNNYLSCKGGIPAEIDFSKYNLILAAGNTTSGIADLKRNFVLREDGSYLLSVDIWLNAATVVCPWSVAILVPILSEGSEVELAVNTDYKLGRTEPEQLLTMDYELTGCEWTNIFSGQLCVINTVEELNKYISCPGMAPEIDFGKYTLLIARGTATRGIINMDYEFWKGSSDGLSPYSGVGDFYTLEVDIELGMTMEAPIWTIATLVPKLSENPTVFLKIDMDNGLDIEPQPSVKDYIMIKSCSLVYDENGNPPKGFKCYEMNIEPDKVYIIRTEEELAYYTNGQQGLLPPVDFNKNTVVLLEGSSPTGIIEMYRAFINEGNNQYTLNVALELNNLTYVPIWIVGILVPVLPEDALVNANVINI